MLLWYVQEAQSDSRAAPVSTTIALSPGSGAGCANSVTIHSSLLMIVSDGAICQRGSDRYVQIVASGNGK